MDNENQKEMEQDKSICEKILNETEKLINKILDSDSVVENIDVLSKLIDIHKDIKNEEYWKKKEEVYQMRYRENYDNYGEDYGNNYSTYGRRGVPGTGRRRYRGSGAEEHLEKMREKYEEYSEGREAYGRSGNYRAKEDSMKSLKHMLDGLVEFMSTLEEEAESQEEVEMIKKYARKISEM